MRKKGVIKSRGMSFLPRALIKRYQTILMNDKTEEEVNTFLLGKMNELPKMPGYLFDANVAGEPISNPTQNPPLPTAPHYFRERNESTDRFFVIRYEFQKLKSYQEMILNVMEQLKYEFITIPMDISKLGIQPKNTRNIFTIDDCRLGAMELYKKIDTQYNHDFRAFIIDYKRKQNALFESDMIAVGSSAPIYYRIMNTNYKGKAKKFILKLVKEYIGVSKLLQKMQIEYYGILGYEHVFDISKKPIVTVFKQNRVTYKNDFNTNFNNDKIYDETRKNQSVPNSESGNSNENNRVSMNYMALDYNTNIYDQVGNEFLYKNELETKLKETIKKMQELLLKLYTTKKQNLYEIFRLLFQIDFYTNQFILYYTDNLNDYQSALVRKDRIYENISHRIEIYENFVEEFIFWIKSIRGSAEGMGLSIQDPRLTDIFKTFRDFYKDLFNKTKEERAANIRENMTKMGITNIEISQTFDEMSDEELKELIDILNTLESIIS
jgi:hypothetical protein